MQQQSWRPLQAGDSRRWLTVDGDLAELVSRFLDHLPQGIGTTLGSRLGRKIKSSGLDVDDDLILRRCKRQTTHGRLDALGAKSSAKAQNLSADLLRQRRLGKILGAC